MTTHATEKPLPRSVDLRPNFKKWNIPCRPQGARGTCSVFTVVGALEYALAKEQGKGAALSIEFLNWAGHKATNRDADGGFFSELWKGYEAHGVCLEEELGYQKTFNGALQPENAVLESAKSRKSAAIQLNWLKEWNPNTGLEETAFLEIKRTLSRRFPVCGGFRWPKKAEWHKGVLAMCAPEQVFDGHSVLLVGYRDDPKQPGGGVFLIHNSASKSLEGALSYEYVRAYMNDAAWIGSTKTTQR